MKRNFEMKTIKMIFFVVFVFVGCNPQQNQIVFQSNGKVDYPLSNSETKLLDSIQYRSFLYFINESDHETGLVKDRSANWAPASIAAIGFALPSYAVGVERNWIAREEAAKITLNTLNFFLSA